MYVVTANISVAASDEVQELLMNMGVSRLRMAAINGYTRGQTREIVYRGVRRQLHLYPEVELETVVSDESVDDVVAAIIRLSQRLHDDGYVVVTPIDQCYRIRTGAREL